MVKKIVIILIIIVLIILSVFLFFKKANNNLDAPVNISLQKDKQAKGPIIEISPLSYDFGSVIYGQVVKHTFIVKNKGNESLNILRLSTSCGCTSTQMENKTILPDQSSNLIVTFDPAVHKDDSDLGNVTRTIYIKSNDLKNPETEVNIKATVLKKEEKISSQPASQVKIIKIIAKKWSFNPNVIKVKTGEKVQLKITSMDVIHGFALPDFKINELIEPGKEKIINLTADKKGTFNFFCSVPCGQGHKTMTGKLIIE